MELAPIERSGTRVASSSPPIVGAGVLAALCLLTTAATPQSGPAGVSFAVRTQQAGIDFDFVYGASERPYVTDSGGAGAAWVDYDLDGWIDLLLLNGLAGPSDQPYEATAAALAGRPLPQSLPRGSSPDDLPRHALLRNNRGTLARAPRHSGIEESVWASAAATADVDNDGFPDVYVTAIGTNRLYRNNGDGTFSVWDAGVQDDHFGTGAAFVEWSDAGQLDLYLVNYVDFDGPGTATLGDGACHYLGIEVFCGPIGLRGDRDVLFRSNASGGFKPSDDPAVDPDSLYGFAALPFDCDGQPPAELYVANDSNINLLYRLTESGLEDLSLLSGAGFSAGGMEQAGMGITSADYDGDGDFDLLVTNFQHDYNTLYENLGDCTFVDVTADRGLAAAPYPYMGWAPLFLDLDGDGDKDLFVANGHLYPQIAGRGLEPFGQRNLVFLNRLRETGSPTFDEVGALAGAGLDLELTSRTAASGDYDNDGDLDLIITHMDVGPELLANEATMRFPPLTLTLIGRSANRSALGSVVRVKSGDLQQWVELHPGDGYLGANDPRLLFYLPSGQAEEIEIRWPDGRTTLLHEIASGRVVIDQERGVIARAPEPSRTLAAPGASVVGPGAAPTARVQGKS